MKYAGDRGDPYLDSETGVLRNLLGIKEQGGLDKAESTLFLFCGFVKCESSPSKTYLNQESRSTE